MRVFTPPGSIRPSRSISAIASSRRASSDATGSVFPAPEMRRNASSACARVSAAQSAMSSAVIGSAAKAGSSVGVAKATCSSPVRWPSTSDRSSGNGKSSFPGSTPSWVSERS